MIVVGVRRCPTLALWLSCSIPKRGKLLLFANNSNFETNLFGHLILKSEYFLNSAFDYQKLRVYSYFPYVTAGAISLKSRTPSKAKTKAKTVAISVLNRPDSRAAPTVVPGRRSSRRRLQLFVKTKPTVFRTRRSG
jgi:hypothetical protein